MSTKNSVCNMSIQNSETTNATSNPITLSANPGTITSNTTALISANTATKQDSKLREPYIEPYEKRRDIFHWCCKVAAWLHMQFVMSSPFISSTGFINEERCKEQLEILANEIANLLRTGLYTKNTSENIKAGQSNYFCELVKELEKITQGSYYSFEYLSKIIFALFVRLFDRCVETKKLLPPEWTRGCVDRVFLLIDHLKNCSAAEDIIDNIRANEKTLPDE